MFSYRWDEETGGIVLTTDQGDSSVEVRPVYARELAMLNMPWMFEMQDDMPYMWARTNQYWYRGRLVAKVHGACMYKEPKIEIVDAPEPPQTLLRPVDVEAMVAKSADRLEALEQATVKNIYHTYMKYKSRVDVFYVAFSGGKDSVVVLDIVARALPHKAFKVVFGDTRMEFSDTYDLVDEVESWCRQNGIEFIRAQSHLSPIESWNAFGPPAQRIRWCCSVHKSTPQILKLREILAKPDFRGMAFTGIRGEESAARSQYDEISFGAKVNGQYSFHPILDWSAAEVYMYMYKHHLYINEAYKKGQGRVGCLVCPLGAAKNIYFKERCYGSPEGASLGSEIFNDIILKTSSKKFPNKKASEEFMDIGGWKARRSGRELSIAKDVFRVDVIDDGFIIRCKNVKSDWQEWIKTVGDVVSNSNGVVHVRTKEGAIYKLEMITDGDETQIKVVFSCTNRNTIAFGAAIKNVFRKATYCVYCRVCEASCPYGNLTMKDGVIKISDKCIKCLKCHEVAGGCLVANSLRLPNCERTETMATETKKALSIDRYSNHGMYIEWLRDYLKYGDEFWERDGHPENNKRSAFSNFMADADLVARGKNGKKNEQLCSIIAKYGVENEVSNGLLACNLAYSPQINWWLKNIKPHVKYTVEMLKLLMPENMKDDHKGNICNGFKRLFHSFKTMSRDLGLGVCDLTVKQSGGTERITLNSATRGTWHNPDPRVILYSLYLFAEHCDGYYQFTLSRLLEHEIESEGMSPTEIFNIDRETMKRILTGLSIDYSAFIHASFTHDLDIIDLDKTKTSKDVLSLFE